jgi:hypothetical protein
MLEGMGIVLGVTTECRPPPPSLRVAKAGRNQLNEEITPLLPAEIDERCSQTISNLGRAVRDLTRDGRSST